ncbi:NAD(P)-binding protein [Hyaloscypha variabilis F]|uniref:NAD(P)-binding protein n=1 Tax=Hyaloscypha variabilis (strain UAMH 11265 / GT02V1 / F) TaxID=1149755 RepID=A0A2J6S544_HYAVF|nr:NAD(P)-binding protein [Hyaloscypha variabilis F]
MLVLIAGITGGLGQRLAKVALSRGLSVRGLGRNPSKLPSSLSNQLESFITSTSYYDIPALSVAMQGVDAVINASAPHPLLDLDGHLLLLRAAERAGIRIFIASSWSRDWTNINFGDFEHYNNHIAFEHQVATSSFIKPVYILTGLFADLLYTVYGPGKFVVKEGEGPRMEYWGDGNRDKYPWTTQENAAAWTIDILMHGTGVQAGEGGFFKIRSGVTTIDELAAVKVTKRGSTANLVAELARLRKEKGRVNYIEYMSEEAAVVANKGLWENNEVAMLEEFEKPTSLEDWLRGDKSKLVV